MSSASLSQLHGAVSTSCTPVVAVAKGWQPLLFVVMVICWCILMNAAPWQWIGMCVDLDFEFYVFVLILFSIYNMFCLHFVKFVPFLSEPPPSGMIAVSGMGFITLEVCSYLKAEDDITTVLGSLIVGMAANAWAYVPLCDYMCTSVFSEYLQCPCANAYICMNIQTHMHAFCDTL